MIGARPLSPEEKIIKGRIHLLLKYPFFGYLALGLELKERIDLTPPTMSTDGVHLFYDRGFVEKLSPQELRAIIIHETLHCALGHLWRMGERSRLKWNYATDYAVNIIVSDDGFVLPSDVLLNSKYRNMSAEKIYNLLPDPQRLRGTLLDSHDEWPRIPSPNSDSEEPNQPDQDSKDNNLKNEWQDRLLQAANISRTMGNLPGWAKDLIPDILAPKLDWKSILRDKIMASAINDFRFFPPSKKHLWQGIYLPSTHGQTLEIAIGIDTSGSVSQEQFQEFLAEIRGITEQFENYTLHLFFCDTQVHDDIILDNYSAWPKAFPKHSGGTAFEPVTEKIDKLDLTISALVYLTDGDGSFPIYEPGYPVIWLLNKESEVPWGSKIIMD